MHELMTQAPAIITLDDTACDLCGTEFDATTVNDSFSQTLCPCCTQATRSTHGMDILFPSRRR